MTDEENITISFPLYVWTTNRQVIRAVCERLFPPSVRADRRFRELRHQVYRSALAQRAEMRKRFVH